MTITIDITDDVWLSYKVETAGEVGSGDPANSGEAAHDHAAMVNADQLKFPRVTSISISPSGPERELIKDINSGMKLADVLTKYNGPGEITLDMYIPNADAVHDDDLYDLAVSCWGSGGDAHGTVGTSLIIHFDNAVTEKDLFGCVIMKWEGTAKVGDSAKQNVTFKYCYVGNGGALTNPGWLSGTTVPSETSFTVDGITSASILAQELRLTVDIERASDPDESMILGDTDNHMFMPYIKDVNVEMEINYMQRGASTWGAFDNAIASADELLDAIVVDAAITWNANVASALTSLYLKDTNSGERTENGPIKHRATFAKGGDITDPFVLA